MSFAFILALVGIGAVLIFVLWQLASPRPKPQLDNEESFPDRNAHLDVGLARVGDMVSVPGAGDEFDDLDFRVEHRHRYESGGEIWYELSGRYRGRAVYLELVEDDELEAWLDRGSRDLRLADLHLDEDRLAQMDEDKDHRSSIDHDGEPFFYASSEEVGFFEDSRSNAEGFYTWTFLNRARDRAVWVEKWMDEPFEAGVSQRVPVQDIRVFRS